MNQQKYLRSSNERAIQLTLNYLLTNTPSHFEKRSQPDKDLFNKKWQVLENKEVYQKHTESKNCSQR